jgi:hypothetical protein
MAVRVFLDNELLESWPGHRRLTPWPPRFPDLPHLDFFFWDFVKDYVYRPSVPQSLPELRGRISDAAAQVDAAMLQHMQEKFQYQLDICHITCGANTEHM